MEEFGGKKGKSTICHVLFVTAVEVSYMYFFLLFTIFKQNMSNEKCNIFMKLFFFKLNFLSLFVFDVLVGDLKLQ